MGKPTRVFNFSPGPAKLPESVLERIEREIQSYENTGICVMEMSHRGKEFKEIIASAEGLFRELMDISEEYEVLFLQGGGTGQFASVPMNLGSLSKSDPPCADYLVTGTWSSKAVKEAEKYVKVNKCINLDSFTRIPDQTEWTCDPNAAYLYYCANETINGVEFHYVPESQYNIPVVADVSSNFLSRPIDVSKHGILFGGAQKNIGAAGLTVAIVRKDLIGFASKYCPSIFDYHVMHENGSVYNTPPVFGVILPTDDGAYLCTETSRINPSIPRIVPFISSMSQPISSTLFLEPPIRGSWTNGAIYVTKLVLEWIKQQGGISAVSDSNLEKSQLLYDVINSTDGFYYCPVEESCRSRMNIAFRIGGAGGNAELEKKFIQQTEEKGMISLKGHRSVGGMRASLYNAVTLEETQTLADFMREFHQTNGQTS